MNRCDRRSDDIFRARTAATSATCASTCRRAWSGTRRRCRSVPGRAGFRSTRRRQPERPAGVLPAGIGRGHRLGRPSATTHRTVADPAIVVFNLEPPPGVAASFGFSSWARRPSSTPSCAPTASTRSASTSATPSTQVLRCSGSGWRCGANPADPSHDAQRCTHDRPLGRDPAGPPAGGCDGSSGRATRPARRCGPNPFPGDHPRKAFLTLPTACTPPGVGLETRMHVEPWDPAVRRTTRASSAICRRATIRNDESTWDPSTWGPPQGPTGCDQVPFDPSFSARPDSSTARFADGAHR